MGRKWRQRPIACQSCRRRKIRCSRDFPCSNCTSRGIKCVQFYESQEADNAGPAPKPEPASQLQLPSLSSPDAPAPAPGPDSKTISSLFSNADIQAHLNRLENWITGAGVPSLDTSSVPKLNNSVAQQEQLPTSSDPQQLPTSLRAETVNQMTADALWLGGNVVFTKTSIMATDPSPDGISFDGRFSCHLTPIRLIEKPYCILQNTDAVQGGLSARQKFIFLPLYHEACTILKTFVLEYAVLSSTIHVPTLLQCIQTLYANIQDNKPVDREELLLFFSVVGAVTYIASANDDVSKLFDSHLEANSRCTTWVDASFAMSDELRTRGRASIMCLQGHGILVKVATYLEGSSVRSHALLSTSIAMAREMGLHRIDLPGEKTALTSPMEIEIARRLWWENVIFDWLLPLFPGPQEGVYTVNPQHMAVNKPSIVRYDTADGNQDPLVNLYNQASDASYLSVRIRLAEIGREFIDSCPLSSMVGNEFKYERLREYNDKLENFHDSLPSDLVLRKAGDLSQPRGQEHQSLIHQRLQINFIIHLVRGIVHLRFLSLASVDSKYSFSTTLCFNCARDIVWMTKVVKSDYPWIIPRLRATLLLRTLLLASVIFLLDICSGTQVQDMHSERPEMLEAWRLLREFQEDSNLIEQFFDFASRMLQKYNVSNSIISALTEASTLGVDVIAAVPPPATFSFNDPIMDGSGAPHSMPMDTSERWQSLDTDFDIKTMSWDNVLWGFDTVLM